MATISKRGDGQWQVKVRRAGYPTVSKTFDIKVDAERWARMIETEMDRGVFVSRIDSETTTLEQALQRYLAEVTPSKKSAEQEANRVRAWMKQPLAKRFLATIRGADIATYRDERLAAGKSPHTVGLELAVISHLYNIARKEWGMEGLMNPVANVRKPKLPAGRDRRLLEGEEQRLLDVADSLMKDLITLALETGMRLGEMLGIWWKHVDLKRGVITLPDTKNGDVRYVPLSPRARELLKKMPRDISGKVFPWMKSTNASHIFADVCKQAGINGLRFHDLRHEATSRLFEKGLDTMTVSAVTGHKTLHMLKRYTHLRAEDIVVMLAR